MARARVRLLPIVVFAAGLFGATSCRSDVNFEPVVVLPPQPNPLDFATPVQVDRIQQATIPLVDVLFVVDNSCSMDVEQASLAANFPAMLDWFIGSGLEYHIGVVSTDMNDPLHAGRLQGPSGLKWVDPLTEGPEAVFASMVQMGTTGHWEEQGRAAAYTAIELLGDTENLGFVREGAGMHITVVSDENDDSGESPISRGEWIDYLQGFRWSERLVSSSSIVGPITGCPEIGSPGTEYTAVTAEVGGVFWPICSDDWSAILDDLGFIATGLSREFFLSRLPVVDTIVVREEAAGGVRDFLQDVDWVYDPERNSVQFIEYIPEPLSIVELRYEVLASVDGIAAQVGTTLPSR